MTFKRIRKSANITIVLSALGFFLMHESLDGLLRHFAGKGHVSVSRHITWGSYEEILDFENQFFRTEASQFILKKDIWHTNGANRRPCAPIITGDGFRDLADFICEPDNCDLTLLQRSQLSNELKLPIIAYVKQDFLNGFIEDIVPAFRSADLTFVLITHNSDAPAPGGPNQALLEEPFLVKWFAQNVVRKHPKLSPIPIGFENRYIARRDVEDIVRARRSSILTHPSKFLLSAFSVHTCPQVREPLGRLVEERFARHATTPSSGGETDWYQNIMDHHLVLCPRGNGLDTHRVWETLYLGRIPVVKSSAMDEVFDDLPVILVNNWENMTLSSLEVAHEKVLKGITRKTYKPQRLRLSYYACEILKSAGRHCVSPNRELL